MFMDRKTYVYKITRNDGLEYVGITVDPNKRFYNHKRSERFSEGIKGIQILKECDGYDEAQKFEEQFINQFDTYNNGLNKTKSGKGCGHNSPKFTTLGYKFSEGSKRKMSENHWTKLGFENGMKGKKHSEEVKKKWSKLRKGVVWGPVSFDMRFVEKMREEYENETINFDEEFIKQHVKKSHIDLVGKLPIDKLVMKSGKPLTYKSLFTTHYSLLTQKSKRHIANIIERKSYNGTIHQSER